MLRPTHAFAFFPLLLCMGAWAAQDDPKSATENISNHSTHTSPEQAKSTKAQTGLAVFHDGVELSEIASRYEAALRNASLVRVDFMQQQDDPPMKVAGVSWMAPGSFKTIVWDTSGPAPKFLASLAAFEEGATEVRPGSGTDRAPTRRVFDAQGPNAYAESPSPAPTDCMWGSNTESWVGPKSDLATLFAERIRSGTREPDQDVQGSPCYVITWNFGDAVVKGYQRFFIDKHTNFLVRLDGQQVVDGVSTNRRREHVFTTVNVQSPGWTATLPDADSTEFQRIPRHLTR